jgi:capsid assembly protease
MRSEFPKVLGSFYSQPWAILPAKLAEIERVMWVRIKSGKGTDFKAASRSKQGDDENQYYKCVGNVAVIEMRGTISQRPSLFASGGCSAEMIGKAIDAAIEDKAVVTIMIHCDSPGGSVYGIMECADKIFAARSRKPIIAQINPLCASAALWLCSQANSISITPSGQIGSIGVIAAHIDESEMERQLGLKTTLVTATASKYKAEMDPSQPLSPEARAWLQDSVDTYMTQFVAAVSRGRRVSTATVETRYGQGRVMGAQDALKAGMVDRIATMETTLADALKSGGRGRSALGNNAETKRAATAAALSPKEIAHRKRLVQMAENGVRTD